MKLKKCLMVGIACAAMSVVHGEESLSIGIGSGDESATVYRLSAHKPFNSRWWQSDTGYLSGHHELSLSWWEGNENSLGTLSYTPVLAYYRPLSQKHYILFVEAGVGVALLTDTEFGRRDLSSNYQFEDLLGVGLLFGPESRHSLALRLMHYSNAGLKKPNNGMNLIFMNVTLGF